MRTQSLTPSHSPVRNTSAQNTSAQVMTQVAPPESAAHLQLNTVDLILSISVIALPLLVVLGVVGHKRQRARVLRQRVELLERLWCLNYQKFPNPPKSSNSGGL